MRGRGGRSAGQGTPARPAGASPTGWAGPPPGPGVHLFVGEEDLLVEEGVRALVDAALAPDERTLNLDVLEAAETSLPDLLARLDTLPFFGALRVVVVRDLDTLPPDAQRALADYLERGTPPVLAIFTARALDRRGRLFRALQAAGRIHPCDPLTWREVPAWLTREAARMGKRLTPGAVEALAAGSGAGLRALRLELEKLAAYVDDRPQITEEDVRAVGALESDPRLFALADAIGERHVRRATQLLQGILAREHPLPVLGMIARQFRLLVRAREAGRSQAAVARAAGVTPYVAGKLLRQVTRYGAEDFPAIFALLEEADRAIKSTGQPELALETLVVQLCAGPGRQGDTGAG